MKRRLLNLLAGLSLLLCVAVSGLFLLNLLAIHPRVQFRSGGGWWQITAVAGNLWLEKKVSPQDDQPLIGGGSIPLSALWLGAVIPLWWWKVRSRTPPTHTDHLCRNCGYDLRATPDRCPECGTEPVSGSVSGG